MRWSLKGARRFPLYHKGTVLRRVFDDEILTEIQ
jgi:hypothetical protein